MKKCIYFYLYYDFLLVTAVPLYCGGYEHRVVWVTHGAAPVHMVAMTCTVVIAECGILLVTLGAAAVPRVALTIT